MFLGKSFYLDFSFKIFVLFFVVVVVVIACLSVFLRLSTLFLTDEELHTFHQEKESKKGQGVKKNFFLMFIEFKILETGNVSRSSINK